MEYRTGDGRSRRPPPMPPDDLIGVVAHQGVRLGRGDGIAVGLRHTTAVPTGLALVIAVRGVGNAPPGRRRPGRMPGCNDWSELSRPACSKTSTPLDAGDLAGFELAVLDQDGRPQRLFAYAAETSICDDYRYRCDATYFVSPLPPDGTLTVVCSCPELGLAEKRTRLELPDLTTRAAEAFSLWDSGDGGLR